MKNNVSDLRAGISGLLWLSSNTGFNYVIQLIILFFLARLLSPAEFGEIATLTILIGFADLFWQLGVGPAVVQKNELYEDDIITAQTISILLGGLVFALINCFAPFWIKVFNIDDILMLQAYSLVFIINSFFAISQSLNQKNCNFQVISIIRSVSILIYGLFAIFFAFRGFGAWSIVWATLIKTAFQCIAFYASQPVSLRFRINIQSAKELLDFGAGYTLARIFTYSATNGDNYITSILLGKGSTGLGSYSRAYQLLMYPVQLVGETIDQVLFPLLSQSQDDSDKMRKVFLNGTGIILLLSIPTSIVAFVRAKEIVDFVLGSQWGNVVTPFKIMVVCLFFRIAYKLGETILRSIGKVYLILWIQIVYAVLVLVGAFIGTRYGISGVAAGATIAFTINCIIITIVVLKMFSIKISELYSYLTPVLIVGLISILFTIPYEQIVYISNSFLSCVGFTSYIFLVFTVAYLLIGTRIIKKDLQAFIRNIFINILDKLGRRNKNISFKGR